MLYKNNINKKINNNKELCHVKEDSSYRYSNVEDTLNNVYAGLGRNYNTNVLIDTDKKVYDTTLKYKSNDELITEENELIRVNEIRNIRIKK